MPSWRTTQSRVRLIAALALCLAVITIAAAAPLHGHNGASADACAICQFSSAQFAAELDGPEFRPPDQSTSELVRAVVSAPARVESGPARGRAPPAG